MNGKGTPHSKARIATTALIILLISTTSYSQIFQWVDEQGRTHFSDKPRNNLYTGKTTNAPEFTPLPEDNRPALEKLTLLKGRWKQTQSSPSLTEMTNLLSSLWQLPDNQRAKFTKKDSILTMDQARILIENGPASDTVQNNTDTEERFSKTFAAKLEFYNGTPLEIGGFWNFEQGVNPFISAFLGQVSMDNEKMKGTEQARFDIQGEKLMVTVKLPEKLRVPTLKIIYEKLDDEILSLEEQSSPQTSMPEEYNAPVTPATQPGTFPSISPVQKK